MPEIRITRSAGQSWDARFNNQTPPCKSTDCPDKDSGTVASIAEITGSLGPMGSVPGAPAPPPELKNLQDVTINNLAAGDVLRYAGDKWRNYNETNLTDGGNF